MKLAIGIFGCLILCFSSFFLGVVAGQVRVRNQMKQVIRAHEELDNVQNAYIDRLKRELELEKKR